MRSRLLAANVLLILAAPFAPAVATPAYTLTDIGTLGGTYSQGFAINNIGQITGQSATSSGGADAFIYSNGVMTDLGSLGGGSSVGYGINASGQVTGLSGHAFIYSGGVMTDIGTLGGAASVGYAINASGQITGFSLTAGNNVDHAFLYTNGVMTDLGSLGGSYSSGYGINSAGQVVGATISFTPPNTYSEYAFLDINGIMTYLDFGALSGTYSEGTAINDHGQITGLSFPLEAKGEQAFLYSGGITTDLGTLGGSGSFGMAINNNGQVVGQSNTSNDRTAHAFLFSDGTMYDLNSLIAPGTPLPLDFPLSGSFALTEATAINDAGQIVANGNNDRAYLLTPEAAPVPEPAALAVLTLPMSVVGVLLARRRKHMV